MKLLVITSFVIVLAQNVCAGTLGAVIRDPITRNSRNYYQIIPNRDYNYLYDNTGNIGKYRLTHTLPLTGYHDTWSRRYLPNHFHDIGLGAVVRHPFKYDNQNYYHIIPNKHYDHLYDNAGDIGKYRLTHTLPLNGVHNDWSRRYLPSFGDGTVNNDTPQPTGTTLSPETQAVPPQEGPTELNNDGATGTGPSQEPSTVYGSTGSGYSSDSSNSSSNSGSNSSTNASTDNPSQ